MRRVGGGDGRVLDIATQDAVLRMEAALRQSIAEAKTGLTRWILGAVGLQTLIIVGVLLVAWRR